MNQAAKAPERGRRENEIGHGRSDCRFPAPTNEDGVVRESLLAVVPVQLSAGTSATVSRVPVASA